MKLNTEDEKRMWRESYCAALGGMLAAGVPATQATTREAAAMADHSFAHWKQTAKEE